MDLQKKLAILADAAKYDASCASSGTTRRNSRASGGLGSTTAREFATATRWTEVRAVWNRGQAATWEGLVAIEQAQPFFLRGESS